MAAVVMARRRSHVPLVLAGVVVVAAGFAIGAVELLRFPRGSVWIVVAVAAVIVGLIRLCTRR